MNIEHFYFVLLFELYIFNFFFICFQAFGNIYKRKKTLREKERNHFIPILN